MTLSLESEGGHNDNKVEVKKRKRESSLPPGRTAHLPPRAPLSTVRVEELPDLPRITPQLASQVFTHESALYGDSRLKRVHLSYERLELLGDAYLEIIASRLVFARFADHTAGQLSQQREALVKNETLAAFSQAYEFDKKICLGSETARKTVSDRYAWIKIMGDVIEAYTGAVVLSSTDGFHIAESWLQSMWEKILPKAPAEPIDEMAKQKLAKKVMSKGIKIEYVEEAPPVAGKQNKGMQVFTQGVYLTGWGFEKQRLGSGKGSSHREAGQRAASQALRHQLLPKIEHLKCRHEAKVKEARMEQGSKSSQSNEKTDNF